MSAESKAARLYAKYYAGDKARAGVFDAVASWMQPRRVLYPGSFVHVAASFVFPDVTYVDTDRRAARFFADEEEVRSLLNARKRYSAEPRVRFHASTYEAPLDEPDGRFNLLISLYAGFISKPCKRYLARGGVLLVNNSHGDAGLASIDPDYRLVGVLAGRGARLSVKESDLDVYFEPKRGVEVTEAGLRAAGRGVAYTVPASAYLFRRVA